MLEYIANSLCYYIFKFSFIHQINKKASPRFLFTSPLFSIQQLCTIFDISLTYDILSVYNY